MQLQSDLKPAIFSDAIYFGLNEDEWRRILCSVGRNPNFVELGLFAVMWSEHCSYKSSKRHLGTLPSSAQWVIYGPGENAGVIDIGDGDACVFKIESHNHPSFIEPYQGAATGVGGIMRDIFTMGARPIANLNALRFGDASHHKTRHLVSRVVAGIGDYGNCVGVPTVGGECQFHPSYNKNIVVNAMTVGVVLTEERIFTSIARGAGNPVFYLGAKTGRDGIHGATMASKEFSEDSESRRPTVQVGDPFTEKLLIEACLELMRTDAIIAIQDMGAAGLTSSSIEMASKGGLGIELDLDRVPTRDNDMSAYEIMLSESQERMLVVLQPEREAEAQAIFERWELECIKIGQLTDNNRIIIRKHGDIVADLELTHLVNDAPVYDRPYEATKPAPYLNPEMILAPPEGIVKALFKLMSSPDIASKRWIWEQYDYLIGGRTAIRPGGDAAVVRVPERNKGLAMTTDCTQRYVNADPVMGGAQAVAESYRNISAVGAQPLAFTNNLNFGNPERPVIMGQLVGAIEGISNASRSLSYPVVSGNVSLYNETDGEAIFPTPVIGGVGLLDNVDKAVPISFTQNKLSIFLIGATEGWLGCSLYLREVFGNEDGAPPPVDLSVEKKHGEAVRRLIRQGLVAACHDLSDGGLLVAVAEMALAGGIGAEITLPPGKTPPHARAFGEDQGRYLLTTDKPEEVKAVLDNSIITYFFLGVTGGDHLTIKDEGTISIAMLRDANEAWLPQLMAANYGS